MMVSNVELSDILMTKFSRRNLTLAATATVMNVWRVIPWGAFKYRKVERNIASDLMMTFTSCRPAFHSSDPKQIQIVNVSEGKQAEISPVCCYLTNSFFQRCCLMPFLCLLLMLTGVYLVVDFSSYTHWLNIWFKTKICLFHLPVETKTLLLCKNQDQDLLL